MGRASDDGRLEPLQSTLDMLGLRTQGPARSGERSVGAARERDRTTHEPGAGDGAARAPSGSLVARRTHARTVAAYGDSVRLPAAPVLAAAAVLGAAIIALLMPAPRASRVDVIQALRSE